MEQSKWYSRRWIALGFLGFSLLVIALDNTVLNLAVAAVTTLIILPTRVRASREDENLSAGPNAVSRQSRSGSG